MTHPAEDELAGYAFDPQAAANRAEIESHIKACPQCQANLTLILWVDSGLKDPEVWDSIESASTGRDTVRRLASEVATEDEDAERLLQGLLTNPARTEFSNLGSKRAYLTAGVVRRLIRAASEAREREPLGALTFADAAIEVAERLSQYPAGMIHDLRANAWKERAGALTLLAEYDAALEALVRAEREFEQAPGAPLGSAIVRHARAIVHYNRGELTSAKKLAADSADAYAALGQTELWMRARHLVANIAFGIGDIGEARGIYEGLLECGEREGDLRWIARESNTLGRCALEMGDVTTADEQFQRSIVAFGDLGLTSEQLRPRWGVALVFLRSGKAADALSRLLQLRAEFHRRSMLSDEALIAIDIMDALHVLGRDAESADIAREVMTAFTRAGMLTSALAAFAYLKDAAQAGTVAPRLTSHVRSFLGRLERAPALLFRPPEENV